MDWISLVEELYKANTGQESDTYYIHKDIFIFGALRGFVGGWKSSLISGKRTYILLLFIILFNGLFLSVLIAACWRL